MMYFLSPGGAGLLHAVDMSDPAHAHLVHSEPVVGVPNDLDICGDYVALSVRNVFEPLPGTAVIFRLYDRTSGQMERLYDIPGRSHDKLNSLITNEISLAFQGS